MLLTGTAHATEPHLEPSGSSYGGVGLIETRTARFRFDGALEAGASLRADRRFYFLNFQALPWLETTFRFAERLNATTGSGTTTDRAFDLKLSLLNETDELPALALGFQDLIGTGLYAGEYLVASKRWWDFDLSLGLGWGRLGSAGDFGNPLGRVSDRFNTRPDDVGEGGTIQWNRFFRGDDTALFGGIEWTTPIDGLRLKLEWNGDTLRDERRGDAGEAQSRFNAGLLWRPWPGVEASAAFVHGTDALFRLSYVLDPARPPTVPPPPVAAPPPRVATDALPSTGTVAPAGALTIVVPPTGAELAEAPAPPAPPREPEPPEPEPVLRARIEDGLRRDGFVPGSVALAGDAATIVLRASPWRSLAQTAARAGRIASPHLPPGITRIVVAMHEGGVEIGRVSLSRGSLDAVALGYGSAEEVLTDSRLLPATGEDAFDASPRFTWAVAPLLRTQVMDPDEPFRFDLLAVASARVDVGRGWSFGGALGRRLIGNLDEARPSDSELPRVRSDVGRYAEAEWPILNLQAERVWLAAQDVLLRGTAGYLEPMYAGVSSEVLWRPADKPYALGLDLNWVKQREFDQGFGLRDYDTITGHVSAYVDLPFHDLTATVRAGRYLARDWGGTFELSRRFESGIEIGGFFTLTDVPFSTFGEGSFDKGIFIRFPFDLFPGARSRTTGVALIRPLQRDGGQRLGVATPLWDLTRDGREAEWVRNRAWLGR